MDSKANALVFHLLVGSDDLLPVLDWLSAASTGHGQEDEAFQRVLVGIQEPATRRCYLEVNPRTLQTEILHVAEMAIDRVIACPSGSRPSASHHAAAEPGVSSAASRAITPNPSLNSASDFPKLGAKPPSKASRRRLVPTMVAPSVSTTSRQDSPQLPQAHPQLVGMAPSAEAQLSERLQGAMQLSSGGVGRDDDPFTPPTASMGTWDSRPRAADGMLGPSSTSQRLESRLEEVDADRAPREAPPRTSSDDKKGSGTEGTTSSGCEAAPSGRQTAVEALQDSHPAMRLASLHSSLLLLGAVPNLAQELGRLLHLLAAGLRSLHGDAAGGPLPSGAKATLLGSQGEEIVKALSLHSAGTAWRYAVRVLQGTHRLLLAAPSRALRAIIDESTPLQGQLQADGPQILLAVQQAVEKEHGQRCFNEKAYDMMGSPGSSLLGPMTHGQHSNQGWRSTEEVQRRTNLEKSRDMFVAIMQDAATASVYAMRSHSIEEAKAGVTDEAIPALKFMREQVPKFLLDLRLDNLVGFSEIFLSGYLQAARTGEMIMDDKLASLEQRDPSKFQRLSQRFHTNNPPSAASRTKGRSGGMHHGGGRGRSGSTRGASQRGHTSAGAPAEVPSSLHLVQEFPVPLRMYVLFIEAADSARLNAHISRQATMKIGELSQSQQDNSDQGRAISMASSVASLGERAAQLSALGLLLSFVSFTSQINAGLAPSGLPGRPQPVPSISSIGPLDIESVLEHISHDGSGALLAIAMPLVLSYLRFLTQDLLATAAVQRSPVVRLLKQLRHREELQPSHPSFGLPALCIRALLDDWASGVGGTKLLESEQIAAASELPADPISMPSAWSRVNEMLQEIQGSIDARYVSICCPALEDGTRGMLSSLAGPAQGTAAFPNGSRTTTAPRRLTPSQPSPLPTGVGAVPESLRQITSRVPDRTRLKLQKAFLDEYSGPGQKVPLRELVAYISDVTASNSVAKAQSAGLAQLLRNLETEMLPIVQNTSKDLQGTDAHQSLLRKVQEGSAFQMLIRSTTIEALEGCLAEARGDSANCIKRSLATLIPPDLEHPVLETAAAIAIEYAEAAIAQQLLNAVPRQIQKHAEHACASACAQIAKSLRNQFRTAQSSANEPLQQQQQQAVQAAINPERTPSEAFRRIQVTAANDISTQSSLAHRQQQDPSSSLGLVSSDDAHQAAAGKLDERKAHALMSRMG